MHIYQTMSDNADIVNYHFCQTCSSPIMISSSYYDKAIRLMSSLVDTPIKSCKHSNTWIIRKPKWANLVQSDYNFIAGPNSTHLTNMTKSELAIMELPFKGKCLCGRVNWQANSKPLIQIECHCNNCQKSSPSNISIALHRSYWAVNIFGLAMCSHRR